MPSLEFDFFENCRVLDGQAIVADVLKRVQ